MNSFQSSITWSWGLFKTRTAQHRQRPKTGYSSPPRWRRSVPLRPRAAPRRPAELRSCSSAKITRSSRSRWSAPSVRMTSPRRCETKGFDVIFSANPANSRARAALLDFSRQAKGADLAVAFLIGHVIAAGGQSLFPAGEHGTERRNRPVFPRNFHCLRCADRRPRQGWSGDRAHDDAEFRNLHSRPGLASRKRRREPEIRRHGLLVLGQIAGVAH